MKKICNVFLLISFSILIANAQDQIVKTNGDEIFGKVIRVNLSDIIYKKEDNIDGPEYAELKSNILFIKYENGIKEIFTQINTHVANSSALADECGVTKRKNSVFFEGAGNGFFYSLNYERRFFVKQNNFISTKLGYSFFGTFSIVNATVTYNIGDGMNFLEIGGGIGADLVIGESDAFISPETFYYFTPTIGYRRQSNNGLCSGHYNHTYY